MVECEEIRGLMTTTTTACHKRHIKTNECDAKHENESHHLNNYHHYEFPVDEEPNILGHGTSLNEHYASYHHHYENDGGDADEDDCGDEGKTIIKRNYCCAGGTATDGKLTKHKMVLNFDDAPDHLKFNPYIRRGYRTFLSTKLCLQSVFWWTNETVNIWSHLVGCIFFIGLTIFDFQFLKAHAEPSDQVLVVCLLVCFCLCMLLSSIYHIFSCKSEQHYDFFLSVDFLGISLSLVAIYISGMYYAFWCFKTPRIIYSVIALAIFVLAMAMQVPKFNVSLDAKITLLITWAAYGVIPLAHWTVAMGGFDNELVQLMMPRIVTMYLLCIIAFVFYAAKIPERWLTGKVDFCGHSHNWWHLFILVAFYHWHNTGIVYAEYRMNNGCNIPILK